MTREEAIQVLQDMAMRFVPTDQYGDYDDPQPYEDAIDMAIEALHREEAEEKGYCHRIRPSNVEVVVRCKDCRHWNSGTKGCKRNPSVEAWYETDFCNYGERKGGEDE